MWNIINPATVSEFLWPNLALFLPNEQRLPVGFKKNFNIKFEQEITYITHT